MLRAVVTIYLVYVLFVVLVTLFAYGDTDELRMRFWRAVATACQGAARVLGRAGLLAERRYHLARSA